MGSKTIPEQNGSLTPAGRKRYPDQDSNDESAKTKKKGLSDKQKKALKIGAAVVGASLAAYGTYKVAKFVQGKQIDKAQRIADEFIRKNSVTNYNSIFGDGTVEVRDWSNGRMSNLGKMSYSEAKVHKFTTDLHNEHVREKAEKMYLDNVTSGTLNRTVNRIVDAGDATKAAAATTSNLSKKAAKLVRDEYRKNRWG